jgi:NADP-dependent 3-hydroxy acid dehydrogenase YdfG
MKKIIITGGASGLGKETAIKLADSGEKVIVIDKAKANFKNKNITFYLCDISDMSKVQKTIKEIFKKEKNIDVLVNNAGIWSDAKLENKNKNRALETIKTNLLGTINITEELLPFFLKKRKGIILNVISASATNLFDNLSEWRIYGASKWGVNGYTKALVDKTKGTRIKISALYPGGFDSSLYENAGWSKKDSHKQNWMMNANDIADLIVFILSRPTDMVVNELVVSKEMM